MKQIITIEIDNETGIEFEEVAEHRIPKKGEYFIAGQSTGIESAVDDFSRAHYFVLTPKVDHELEEAKKKFPVGSYYTTTERMSGVFAKVESVERVELREKNRVCVITSDICSTVESCTPFPLPVWRCCESDPPKKDNYYPARKKQEVTNYNLLSFKNGFWNVPVDVREYEWLDEGGE